MPKPFGIVDIPATLPLELVLDLPLPPSVNRTMGDRLGNQHPKVKQWRKSADAHLLFTRQSKCLRLIEGPVVIEILWDNQTLGDVDNRIKHLLDYLERLRVVSNDSMCRDLRARFGPAPDGCRVRLRPWDWQL